MKRLLVILSIIFSFAFIPVEDPITPSERKFAADYLASVQKSLVDKVKALSPAQLKYKPSPESWSVEECVKHIAITEKNLWHFADSIIQAAPNPEKRSEIKTSDQQIIDMLTDRSQKFKAPEEVQPQRSPYASAAAALQSFTESRNQLIQYVNTTDAALRDHVVAFPLGHADSYQLILFIGAHSQRHTKQIEEVMSAPGFPKQ